MTLQQRLGTLGLALFALVLAEPGLATADPIVFSASGTNAGTNSSSFSGHLPCFRR